MSFFESPGHEYLFTKLYNTQLDININHTPNNFQNTVKFNMFQCFNFGAYSLIDLWWPSGSITVSQPYTHELMNYFKGRIHKIGQRADIIPEVGQI